MKLCNICHKISATNKDHIDCVQKRSIELEDENFKNEITEKLNLSKLILGAFHHQIGYLELCLLCYHAGNMFVEQFSCP